ncbi:M23 family metallopeptidase [Solicola sp. PLA-1-18]|uniref:M23 family metallopeptidase n=1 Tax=Solicola sp. PLA-1-18 TaxID=3380532 RepID=UPI003B75DC60
MLLRSPLVAGVAALAVAAGGAIALNQGADTQNVSDQQSGQTFDAVDQSVRGAQPQVSRSSERVDRAVLVKQAAQQAEQRTAALAQLTAKSGQRATTLAKAEEERLKNQWVLPTTGYRLTARFGQSSSLWSTVHTGLDFAAPSGTKLVAVAKGTVTSVGFDGAYGNKTVLTLEDGTEIWYCHQSATSVTAGQEVQPGDTIGAVGSTGNVTGPHLHLEVRPGGGDPVDPAPVLKSHNVNP